MAGENNDFKIIIGADIADAKSKLKDLSNSLSSLSRNTGAAGDSIGSSMGKISSLFSGLGATLSVASFGLFIKSALQTSAQLEQTAISFEVFTGSALVAKNMLSELKDQALKSPMQFQDITKGAQTLLGYGLTASQVIPITKMLGDVSGGNADKFQRLSLAFGQVNAAGRLMGQEARQMINAGFNPLQAISDKTGVSMAVLTKKMHDGQISVKDVGDAFTYATSEGGRFFGMADKQSQTLQGQFNKLSESTTFAMAEIGASISKNLQLGDIITHLAGIIDQLKNSFIGSNQEINNTSEFSKVLKFILDALGITIDLTIKAWKGLTFVLDGLLKLGKPIVSFFDEVDRSIIKFADSISSQNPRLASDIKSLIGYFNDFGNVDLSPQNIVDSITKIKQEIASLEASRAQIHIYTSPIALKVVEDTIAKLKNDLKVLESSTGRAVGLTGLNNTPSGAEDSQTKAEKTKIQKLIQNNKDAIAEIAMIWMSSTDKRLAELKLKYDQEIRDYIKYKLDYSNITQKYETEKSKILEEANRKREADNILAHANELAGLTAFYKDIEDKERQRQANAIKSHQEETIGLQMEYPKFAGDFAKDALNNDLANKLKTYGDSVYAATQDVSLNLMAGFSEIAGAALVSGLSLEDTFKSLGAMILGALGDYLIKIGTAAIAAGTVGTILKAFFTGGAATVPELGIAGGMAAVAVGSAMKALSGKVSDTMSKTKNPNTSGAISSVSSKASGSSYQYGGSSYASQSIRMMVDLTGSITATPTGYSINKSFETTLRVTGR